jgi:hypothetical protein
MQLSGGCFIKTPRDTPTATSLQPLAVDAKIYPSHFPVCLLRQNFAPQPPPAWITSLDELAFTITCPFAGIAAPATETPNASKLRMSAPRIA